ncbi:MAG: PorT family protein, partial [Prevotella sp.]|nr:PorT family protein [Prevotella sp.]
FRRLDGGIRIGCVIGYDMFYADLTYDIGLANICHDSFDKSRNGALQFNFGVNF